MKTIKYMVPIYLFHTFISQLLFYTFSFSNWIFSPIIIHLYHLNVSFCIHISAAMFHHGSLHIRTSDSHNTNFQLSPAGFPSAPVCPLQYHINLYNHFDFYRLRSEENPSQTPTGIPITVNSIICVSSEISVLPVWLSIWYSIIPSLPKRSWISL